MSEEANLSELFAKEIRKMTFVLIESNGALRRAMIRVLKEAGVTQIVEAESGKDGVMMLKANRDVGVILCSGELPDMDAFKLMQVLTQDKKFESTTFALVSSNEDKAVIQKSIAAGADGYFVKPFAFPKLKGMIEEAMAMRQKRLALKDLRVQLDHPVRIKIMGEPEMQGRCVELAKTECQIISEQALGFGSRIQIQLAQPGEKVAWFDLLPAAVASSTRGPEGYTSKITFRAKPGKAHGVLTLIGHFVQKQSQ